MENEIVKARLCAAVTGGRGYGISHSWDGSVLTVRSDSGSSSADLLGPAGAKLFVVEIRLEDGVYVSDKSFAEVKAHIGSGELVLCEFVGADSRTDCPLTTYTEYSASFVLHSPFGADAYFTLTADGVTYSLDASEERGAPSQVQCVLEDKVLTVTAVRGWENTVTVIELDDNDVPISVTKDGVTTTLIWEGFDA